MAFLLALSLLPLWSCAPEGSEQVLSNTDTLEFRSESSLQSHFQKHGEETGCKTAEEYLACANDVVADPTSLHKIQREDGDDVFFRTTTGEIVIVSPEGHIRTYFITDLDYYDRQ